MEKVPNDCDVIRFWTDTKSYHLIETCGTALVKWMLIVRTE